MTKPALSIVPATPADDFDDLDALLAESVELAQAKHAAKTNRKLTAEQTALLEANTLAEEMLVWETQALYAHVQRRVCACCASEHAEFLGWYHYQKQTRGSGRRLVRREAVAGVPTAKYTTQRVVEGCMNCIPQTLLEVAETGCDLLAELGGK